MTRRILLLLIVVLAVSVGRQAPLAHRCRSAASSRTSRAPAALVPGPVGPEDITIHPRTGIAYVSATDRRAVLAKHAGAGRDLGVRPQHVPTPFR